MISIAFKNCTQKQFEALYIVILKYNPDNNSCSAKNVLRADICNVY
ncbi:hypothetical protein C3B55_00854 [Candidatus Pseudomonas adelgestsugas]|uniref:Uncharacterized protein n=1 Tax=Candidatus Pseudomonas adelgestsugas TaxID=1302376 RepID=A0ABX5R939_9PSED|nr:hypothetical protein C3B55_00854 [Candidatus Pseudomonas adelgestsugas]